MPCEREYMDARVWDMVCVTASYSSSAAATFVPIVRLSPAKVTPASAKAGRPPLRLMIKQGWLGFVHS